MNDPAQHPQLGQHALTRPGFEEDKRQGLDIRWIWRVIWGHKFSIAGLTLLIMIVSALMVFRQTPLYRAQATLQIEHNQAQISPVQNAVTSSQDYWRYYETQYGLIKRRAIGERVVKTLGYQAPGDVLDEAAPATLEADSPEAPEEQGWSWKSLFPEEWFPTPPPLTPEQKYNGLVNWIVGSISVQPRRNSQLVDIGFVSADPEQAATIANAVAQAYIDDNLAGRLEMNDAATSYLNEELIGLKRKLEASEARLQAYLDEKQLVDVQGVDSLLNQELTLGTSKLAEARKERARAEVLLQQIQRARAQGEDRLVDIGALTDHPQARASYEAYTAAERTAEELSNRYGPLHPRMKQAQSDKEAARAVLQRQLMIAANALERDYQAALEAERLARQDLDQSKDRLRDVDRSEFEYQRLQREVETNEQLYDRFLTQIKESDASERVISANARIINRAMVPTAPFSPNKRRAVMLAMVLGLMISIGLAFLLDHLDNTFKSVEDVEQKLGIPVLGVLQKIKLDGDDKTDPIRHFRENKNSVFSEVIRTIRTGVLLSSLDDRKKIMLVTSSVPGEGKTTVSMNLANALSEMRSVLLIDADMRRPMVAKALESEGRKLNGLSQFITGERKLSECIHRLDPEADLYIMPAGVIPPNPLEMLSSKRFDEALDKLAEKFDHIVIDCAPVLAVSDAMVLSRKASAVVFVIKSDSTPIQAVRNGLKQMQRVGANIVGGVINQVQNKTRRYYGKYSNYGGDYYSYEYYRREDD